VAQAWGVAEILRVIKDYNLDADEMKPVKLKRNEAVDILADI